MKLTVRAKTGAKKAKIVKSTDESFEVWVKERPTDGKVNRAIIRQLADFFDCSPSDISLIRGQKSKIKTLQINR